GGGRPPRLRMPHLRPSVIARGCRSFPRVTGTSVARLGMNDGPRTGANRMKLAGKRIVVTGGSGFLGSHVVDQLSARVPAQIVVARKRDYDLVSRDGAFRLLRDVRPQVVIHLAARVGGIGANRENPGSFFFENLMMGVQLLEECRLHAVEKVVTLGTICAYPKHTPVHLLHHTLLTH